MECIVGEKEWASHAEFMLLLVTIIGSFYILAGKLERQGCAHAARTERLYEMFINIVKEKR